MARRIRITRRQAAPRQQLLSSGVPATKVLVVGKSQRYFEEISGKLQGEPGVQMIGAAQDRIEAAERLVLLRPDVVTIDINLDYELGGIDTAFALRRISPSTAFVLISPYTDAERLAMVPRGLGLDWSYVLDDGDINAADLVTAISSAAWSIPFIDRRVDRSRIGKLQDEATEAVERVLEAPRRNQARKPGSNRPKLGYAGSAGWNGDVQTFRISEDASDDDDQWAGPA